MEGRLEVGDLDVEPERQPREDVMIVDGAHVDECMEPQGKTEQFLAVVDGMWVRWRSSGTRRPTCRSDGDKLLSSDQQVWVEVEVE